MVICVSNDFKHVNCIKLPHAGSYEHAYFHTSVTIIHKVSISLQVLLFCLLKYVGYEYLVIPLYQPVRAILPDYGRYANYNTNSKNEYKRSLLFLPSILNGYSKSSSN